MQLSVFGLVSFAFQKITLGICRSFFIIGGQAVRSCGYVTFCYDLSLGLPLTAPFFPISYSASPFHQLRRVQKYRKKRVRAAETLRKQASHTVYAYNDTGYPTQAIQFSIQPKLLTIQTIPYRRPQK